MQGVAARLTGEGIPFSMKEKGRNIYDHFIAQDLLSYLRIAQGCATRADYLRVSNRPYRNISREAFGAEASLPALKKYYEDLTAGSPDESCKGGKNRSDGMAGSAGFYHGGCGTIPKP